MPKRTGTTTKEYLASIPLPTHGGRYTVISHKFIIDATLSELASKGLQVETELYRCSLDGNIATAVYHIKHEQDPELGMIFTWSNSYDKSMRFKCAIGAFVHTSKNLIIKKEMGSWGRKHTGVADMEALQTIQDQIANANVNFNRIIEDKEKMKLVTVSTQEAAEAVGRLYLEKELLTSEQMGIVKSQFKAPKFDYVSSADSLWVFYNHISYALQRAHPKTWMDQQRLVNWFLCDKFGLNLIQAQPSLNVPITNEVIGEVNIDALEVKTQSVEEVVVSPYRQITLDEAIAEAEQEISEPKGSDFDLDALSLDKVSEVQDFTADVDDFNLLGASSNNIIEDFDL